MLQKAADNVAFRQIPTEKIMNMKRLTLIFVSAIAAASLYAQETYENANIATEDLNGTARYVGMGGAMDALGADISTIATNPAGIGLFRHSAANVSFGFVSQQGGNSFAGVGKTNMSFDQAGFVYARRTGRSSFLNFAFNYHKSRNFDYILSAADALNGSWPTTILSIKSTIFIIMRYCQMIMATFTSITPTVTCLTAQIPATSGSMIST